MRPLFALLVLLSCAGVSRAATFTVTKTTDSADGVCDSDCSLREAITLANANADADTITLDAIGTYTLGSVLPAITSSVTLVGKGASQTILDASGGWPALSLGAYDPTAATFVISSLTVRGGTRGLQADYLVGDTLTVTDCIFSNNSDAGIYLYAPANSGTVTLDNVISRNNAIGIYATTGGYLTMTLRNGSVIENNSSYGVQIAGGNTNGSIVDTTIEGNEHGVSVNTSGSFEVSRSLLRDNIVTSAGLPHGAGIVLLYGNLKLVNSTLSGNKALQYGGGIAVLGGTLQVNNVTLSGNVADRSGAGTGDGGGFALLSGSATINNTLFANNVDSGGQAPDCSGSLGGGDYNLLTSATGCTVGGVANQVAAPLVDVLASNGGKTQTHKLLAGSPALNAGRPTVGAGSGTPCEAGDQRNLALRSNSPRCDIGALESELVELQLQASASPSSLVGGGTSTLSYTVSTLQPNPANNLSLVVTLPYGISLAPSNPFTSKNGSWSCSGSSIVTCTLGILGVGAAATVEIAVQVNSGSATRSVNAKLTSDETKGDLSGDFVPSNNQTVTDLLINPADLKITVQAAGDPTVLSSTVVLTLTATNQGPAGAASVLVYDLLPPGLQLVSAAPSQGSVCAGTTTIECALGTIANGASATVTITTKVVLPGPASNSASVASNEPDPNILDNAVTTSLGPTPDLGGATGSTDGGTTDGTDAGTTGGADAGGTDAQPGNTGATDLGADPGATSTPKSGCSLAAAPSPDALPLLLSLAGIAIRTRRRR